MSEDLTQKMTWEVHETNKNEFLSLGEDMDGISLRVLDLLAGDTYLSGDGKMTLQEGNVAIEAEASDLDAHAIFSAAAIALIRTFY